jgi:hypothetical protein
MYSHVFCFRFDVELPLIDRIRFLSELFAVPEQIKARNDDIYWLRMSIDGDVEFYSNTPELTEAIEERIADAKQRGIKLHESRFATGWVFLYRFARGLLIGTFSWMRRSTSTNGRSRS